MADNLAERAHAIIHQGLSLRDRIEAGEALSVAAEQETLVNMLAPLATEEIWDAEEDPNLEFQFSDEGGLAETVGLSQATIRYALTCWLDEFLLLHSGWAERWREKTLESALYHTALRGQKFWEDARYAEVRGDVEALEILYWCVMLGFRGDWRDKPDQVESWATRIRGLLEAPRAQTDAAPLDWAFVVRETAPLTDLPYRRMVFTAMLSFSLVIPAALLIYWRHWAM